MSEKVAAPAAKSCPAGLPNKHCRCWGLTIAGMLIWSASHVDWVGIPKKEMGEAIRETNTTTQEAGTDKRGTETMTRLAVDTVQVMDMDIRPATTKLRWPPPQPVDESSSDRFTLKRAVAYATFTPTLLMTLGSVASVMGRTCGRLGDWSIARSPWEWISRFVVIWPMATIAMWIKHRQIVANSELVCSSCGGLTRAGRRLAAAPEGSHARIDPFDERCYGDCTQDCIVCGVRRYFAKYQK